MWGIWCWVEEDGRGGLRFSLSERVGAFPAQKKATAGSDRFFESDLGPVLGGELDGDANLTGNGFAVLRSWIPSGALHALDRGFFEFPVG